MVYFCTVPCPTFQRCVVVLDYYYSAEAENKAMALKYIM